MRTPYIFLIAGLLSPFAVAACSSDANLGSAGSPIKKGGTADPVDNDVEDDDPSGPTPSPGDGEDDTPGAGPDKPTEPAVYTNAECVAAGGEVIGDIGDGAIHEPDYLCANGERPLGGIMPGKGEPVAIEGAVCCGAAEPAVYTNAECLAAGGEVIGDIGDGAVHRPDYLCANGERPLGTIVPGKGEPVAIEGAVCCGSAEPAVYTNTECVAKGGEVIGDIGDGAVHRPDYLCANGERPLGTIMPGKGEPTPKEGAVCCGTAGTSCEQIECVRAIECVTACGGQVKQSGCCACPEGTFDSIACEAEQETACQVGDTVYKHGSTNVPDPASCNTCSCQAGEVTGCTKIGCPVECPSGEAMGTECTSCGPTDACLVQRTGCLPTCKSSADCGGGGLCLDGLCRRICG